MTELESQQPADGRLLATLCVKMWNQVSAWNMMFLCQRKSSLGLSKIWRRAILEEYTNTSKVSAASVFSGKEVIQEQGLETTQHVTELRFHKGSLYEIWVSYED